MAFVFVCCRCSYVVGRFPRLETLDRSWGRLSCCHCLYVNETRYRYETMEANFIDYSAWATFINSIGPVGASDIVISAIVLGFFACGFLFGIFELGRITGTILLGITGGLAFGIRIMILKSNLLLSGSSLFPVNWGLVAICGAAGGVSIIWKNAQRNALVRCPICPQGCIYSLDSTLASWLRFHRNLFNISWSGPRHSQAKRHESRSPLFIRQKRIPFSGGSFTFSRRLTSHLLHT